MIVSVVSGENHGIPESGRSVLRLGFEWVLFQRNNITIEECAALALIYGCPLPPPPPFFPLPIVIIITD
jgi:hypothetical protein